MTDTAITGNRLWPSPPELNNMSPHFRLGYGAARDEAVEALRKARWIVEPPCSVEPTPPAEPFLSEHKRRPTAKRDGIGAWLKDEIAYLESIQRTERGEGALSAYKATLKELER